MKNFSLPPAKVRPDLIKFESLEDKLKAITGYLKIETLYCEIANPKDYQYPEPENNLLVTKINIPGKTTTYLKSLLTEYLDILTAEIKSLLYSEEPHETITMRLRLCAELCMEKAEESDTTNELKYDGEFRYEVLIENQWSRASGLYLKFENEHLLELIEHFNIRKHFYLKLAEEFEKALNFHLQTIDLAKKPYSWDSPKAELEISELLYVWETMVHRIKIDENTGATISKFRRDFFGLFGLTNKNYSKKLYQIGDRKFNESFINEMAGALQNFHETK